MSSTLPAGFLLLALFSTFTLGLLQLPDTSGIDGQLTHNLEVDHFFLMWLVFNNEEVQTSNEPFTILAPRNSASKRGSSYHLQKPELVKKSLLNHMVLGKRIDLTNITSELRFETLGGGIVHVRRTNNGDKLKANGVDVIERKIQVPKGILVVLDDYLFPPMDGAEEQVIEESALKKSALQAKFATDKNTTFVEHVLQVLSFLKSGVRVFQHFLSRSNVSKLLHEGEEYTVFVPTDHAFQRWHPIDWGFYPFSVPEFTESVIINHFVKGRLKQENIKDGQVVQTLAGRDIIFKKTPNLSVNGATVVKGDTPVGNGNIMFIGEVLFVSEAVVSKLHQQHRDKETPPLLAFPWFGAQFLSHAFLALERDKRFSHVTRFLNLADLAPHVSGTGYTFFVPTDTAFEELGLDKMPDNYLSTGDGLQILLNHFVKGRLYDKELKDGLELETLGNKKITVQRSKDKVKVNEATIVESEVFVYNLGTMFYIDKVLFSNTSKLPPNTTLLPAVTKTPQTTEKEPQVETVPGEISEGTGTLPDVLFADGTFTTTEIVDTTQNTTTMIK